MPWRGTTKWFLTQGVPEQEKFGGENRRKERKVKKINVERLNLSLEVGPGISKCCALFLVSALPKPNCFSPACLFSLVPWKPGPDTVVQ